MRLAHASSRLILQDSVMRLGHSDRPEAREIPQPVMKGKVISHRLLGDVLEHPTTTAVRWQ